MEIRSRRNSTPDPDAPTKPDTFGTNVWWLFTNETVRAEKVVVNYNELPPGTAHQLHRHAHAEQVVIVIAGDGLHLTDHDRYSVQEGDVIYIPAGEWHGFANGSNATVKIATVYGGIGRREDAGYEIYPGPPFSFDSGSQNYLEHPSI